MAHRTDVAVIGGGFYGCMIAAHLRRYLPRVTLFEERADLMQRASLVNQARVHNGYHYPRSLLTALRSRVSFPRFVHDFPDCIDDGFEKYYAIAAQYSKVTATQFQNFCARIGAPIAPAPAEICELFRPRWVEAVFRVREYAFDAQRLRQRVRDRLDSSQVDVRLQTKVTGLRRGHRGEIVLTCVTPDRMEEIAADRVVNCAYSQINQLLAASGLTVVPLKYELAELALVEMPPALRDKGVTVMCGPFFSFLPFPARGLHTLSHVRYTPHQTWEDGRQHSSAAEIRAAPPPWGTRFQHMRNDAARFLPLVRDCRYVESLWEVKAMLPASEHDDSRPILCQRHPELENLWCVLGSKIDNVYDALDEIDAQFVRREAA
jgi:glycine/D-amino acid oxidase-like deaminating enzyme